MQSFTGHIGSGGDVQIIYNGVGGQTSTGQHFTLLMKGRIADGVVTAGGRTGSGRDFTVRLQCR